jgi:hypothetical protein
MNHRYPTCFSFLLHLWNKDYLCWKSLSHPISSTGEGIGGYLVSLCLRPRRGVSFWMWVPYSQNISVRWTSWGQVIGSLLKVVLPMVEHDKQRSWCQVQCLWALSHHPWL